jgi:hypothetical protein
MAGRAELTLAFSFVHHREAKESRRGYAEGRLRAFGGLLKAIHLTQIGDSPAR